MHERPDILRRTLPLPDRAMALLAGQFSAQTQRKGDLLLRQHRLERRLYFLKTGLARAYSFQQDQEITFWFGTEGDPLLSMKSYVFGAPSYESVELLEDSELFGINIATLRRLYREDIHIANWGRAFAEQELVKAEERLISRQFRSAETRYRELMAGFPELLLRVPLRHIASYLGITPVSLSRIRAGLA